MALFFFASTCDRVALFFFFARGHSSSSSPAADLDFNFGPTSGDPALISAQAALRALTRLLSELMRPG